MVCYGDAITEVHDFVHNTCKLGAVVHILSYIQASEFWHSHEHINLGARFSQPDYVKKAKRGLSARRGCFCRYGARTGSSVYCRGS